MNKAMTEKEHFNRLAQSHKMQWWGSATPAGRFRSHLRAEYAFAYIGDSAIRILELGCACGNFTKNILAIAPPSVQRVIAVDISDAQIALARERIRDQRAEFRVGVIESLDFPDGYFDAIIGDAVLHHLDIETAMREIKRVVRVGGKLFFAEPNMLNPHVFLEKRIGFIRKIAQTSPHETAFYRWKIESLLRCFGLQDARVTPFDFIHPFTPLCLLSGMQRLNCMFEKTPFIRELSGSLFITAQR